MPMPEPRGRPPIWTPREIQNAIISVVNGGIAWQLIFKDLPPRSITFGYFSRWLDAGLFAWINHRLIMADRERVGREASPSAAVLDSQSIKTTESDGPCGYDAGEKVKGRKRQALVDTDWSLQQIAERLRLDFPGDTTMRISHEAIYQALYVQGRGALKRELTTCLRTGQVLRVPRARSLGRGKSFVTPDVLISERPPEVEDRAVPGHWDGDVILGPKSSAIGTQVERTARFTMLLHLPPMDGHEVTPRARTARRRRGTGPRQSARQSPARSRACQSNCGAR